ncbi:DUF6344 domain-containing protein [Streptomyces sp. NPDC050560]|uniref:DUF6344 domain-containing protein n=1 Tax=Streptomyces sp. NPDC050560 TaxID=3365630 RepID=UPI003791656E
MTGTRVMKLWTALVSAIVAVLTALGLAAPAAAATTAAPRPTESCNGNADGAGDRAAIPAHTLPAPTRSDPYGSALPPTMKQRIRAEAHGSSPSCRSSASGSGLLAGALAVTADAARYAARHDTARQGTAVHGPAEGEHDGTTAVVRR